MARTLYLLDPITKSVQKVMLKVRRRNGKNRPTIYLSRMIKEGAHHKAFREKIATKVGKCVSENVRKGMTHQEILDTVTVCGRKYRGTKLFPENKNAGKKTRRQA